MKNINVIGWLLSAFIIILLLNIYKYSDVLQLKCINSDVDGKKYCVRDNDGKEESANMLARVTQKCVKLVKICDKEDSKNPDVIRLKMNFNPKKIYEILPTSEHTAYSENKGEKIAFCLNKTKQGNNRIDENTLMFVAMHELSHVMTVDIGHTPKFWNNFRYLIKRSKDHGLYTLVDYKKNPVQYCGMKIDSSPYFTK